MLIFAADAAYRFVSQTFSPQPEASISTSSSSPSVSAPEDKSEKQLPNSGNTYIVQRLIQARSAPLKISEAEKPVQPETAGGSLSETPGTASAQKPPRLNVKDSDGNTLLHYAAKIDSLKMMRLIIEQANPDIDEQNENGETALQIAVREGHITIVQLLLEKGAKVNQTDSTGKSALDYAIQNAHEDLIRLLLDNGAKIDDNKFSEESIPNSRGTILLFHVAVDLGRFDIVKPLIQHKVVNVNVVDNMGNTALHLAVRRRNTKMVELLLENGAAMHAKNGDGETPWHSAIKEGNEEIARLLLNRDMQIVNVVNGNSETALHLAAKYGHLTIAKFLLEHGANINAKDVEGNTVLHYAVKFGYENLIKFLLEQKELQMNATNNTGDTVLHWAVRERRQSIVLLFLEKGVNIHIKNSFNQTALTCATGQPTILDLLKQHDHKVTTQRG